MLKYFLFIVTLFFHTVANAECKSWRNDFELDPALNKGLGGCDIFVPSVEAGYSSNIGLNLGGSLQFPYEQVNGPDGGSLNGLEVGTNIGVHGVEARVGFRRSAYAMIFSGGYGAGLVYSANWLSAQKAGLYAEFHFIGNFRAELLRSGSETEVQFSIGYRM